MKLIVPYATWMLLMMVLPSSPAGYCWRTAIVGLMLVIVSARFRWREAIKVDAAVIGFLVGLAVFAIWILPEQFGWTWYNKYFIVGEGGTKAVAEADWVMLAIRLFGSAFVISVAEELFFRKWMIPFAGFWWMVGLFAVEHDRWFVGALAGLIYGWLYLRRGLFSAIVAHATTNLVLGLWVLKTGQWQFW